MRRADGTIVQNVHFEDTLVVPSSVHDHETSPIQFEEAEDEVYVDSVRRSPGSMLEDAGRTKAETEEALHKDVARMKPGKLEKITSGKFIAYTGEGAARVKKLLC